METSDIDKVIARIQKLFARSGKDGSTRGASEAEADTAMKIAQELMLKHNLDMATIEAAGSGAGDASQTRVKEALEGKTRFKWQRDLAKYVAEANFCYHLIKSTRVWEPSGTGKVWRHDGEQGDWRIRKEHVFVGRKGNVITAQMMYKYLTGVVEEGAPAEDSRVEVGSTYWAEYEGETYRLKAREGGTFERVGIYGRPGEMVYESLSAAARAITGTATNGYIFWGLGAASTAVSWKEGCADRICERLARRRKDLVAQHDARVRAEEADRAAERAAAERANRAKAERTLRAAPRSVEDTIGSMRAAADEPPDAPSGGSIVRPEGDGEDWTPGEGAPAQPAAGTAMVLASVYDESEREANEELARGWPAGTFAKWRARDAVHEAERAAAEAADRERRAAQPDEEWSPGETAKPETPKQKAARERREAAEYAKNRARWAREGEASARRAEKEYARKDHRAYEAGAEAGERVGLDPQVQAKSNQKKLGG